MDGNKSDTKNNKNGENGYETYVIGDNSGVVSFNNDIKNTSINFENATINGANGGNGSWPSYPINNYGSEMNINNSVINGYQGAVACSAAGTTTMTNCTINKEYFGTSSHTFYINHADAHVIVNSGSYTHKGMDGSLHM